MVEAVHIRLRQDIPGMKRLVLQSDNATCYQNILIPLVLPYFSAAYGVYMVRFIHTKSQNGKGILDAHFAGSMGVLWAWVREENNCIAPTQAVIGLKSHGGLPNTVVELVHHDRKAISSLLSAVQPLESKFDENWQG
ncbi:hypothetical protein PHMEG_00035905 [Phytophthora megakarya]|uniref:Uncharacterized protein n=1 Tax=Phytophthora megakarya TaxID=4795 RepID=A0A225UN03_9STRA|nr:hypothetical protein PHMEG_00035905 [Phytophthora megakarya]